MKKCTNPAREALSYNEVKLCQYNFVTVIPSLLKNSTAAKVMSRREECKNNSRRSEEVLRNAAGMLGLNKLLL